MATRKYSNGGLSAVSSDKAFVQSESVETVFFIAFYDVFWVPFAVVIVAVKGCFYIFQRLKIVR